MSVGHYGACSKHPPEVKIAILNYIETRLKEVIYDEEKGLRARRLIGEHSGFLGVYDPYNTQWDFHVVLKVDQEDPVKAWQEYLEITRAYFKDEMGPDALEAKKILNELLDQCKQPLEIDKVFNASNSKTEISYTIKQMKQIYGLSDVRWARSQ
jgi:hypothetical protein